MALPITGPFVTYEDGPRFMDYRKSYRQAKPYNNVLGYLHDGGYGDEGSSWNWDALDPECVNIASLKMRDRLRQQIYQARSDLLLTANGAKPSFDMIVRRTRDVLDWIGMARRGDIGGMFKKAGLTNASATKFKADWRSHAKNAGDLFLECVFGWMPLIKDINEAVKVLDSEFTPSRRVRATATHSRVHNYREEFHDGPNVSVTREVVNLKSRVGAYVTISIDDADLVSLNQLGFVNLPSAAWDAIPLSYLVDWVIPINKYLQQFTDFVGLREELAGTALKGRADYLWDYTWSSPSSSFHIQKVKQRHTFERRTGVITSEFPNVRDLTGLNPFQGGVLVSMMAQGFGDMPRPQSPKFRKREYNWGHGRRP